MDSCTIPTKLEDLTTSQQEIIHNLCESKPYWKIVEGEIYTNTKGKAFVYLEHPAILWTEAMVAKAGYGTVGEDAIPEDWGSIVIELDGEYEWSRP